MITKKPKSFGKRTPITNKVFPRKYFPVGCGLLVCVTASYYAFTHFNLNPYHMVGETIDEFHGVKVYYNGGVNQISGRNLAVDGYNIGLKYQCVEFIKRYYYERFGHKMPEPLGHAKSFFDPSLMDGKLNRQRMLVQYRNGGDIPPQPEDILVFSGWLFNPYGHVAIITTVDATSLEIIQQNPGPFGASRIKYVVEQRQNKWYVNHKRVLGWLRKPADK
jgi:hypothetical protein